MGRPNKYELPSPVRSGVRISMPIEVADEKRAKNIEQGIGQGKSRMISILWLYRQGHMTKTEAEEEILIGTKEMKAETLSSLNDILDDLNPLGVKHYD